MKLLVSIDDSEHMEKTVSFAAKFGKACGEGGDMTLLHVIEFVEVAEESLAPYHFGPKEDKARELLDKAKKIIEQETGITSCNTRIAIGQVAEQIIKIAEEGGYDNIIMGTRGHTGLKRMVLGSVADSVIRHAHCPVTVVR